MEVKVVEIDQEQIEKEKADKIAKVNELVRQYKEEDNILAGEAVIKMFKPFLIKQCEKYNKLYQGVHSWEAIEQEAMVIFYNLLNEYTIRGTAYFNVFIMKKLPFRLRYFFTKEIRHRTKNLCHQEDQFAQYNLEADNSIDETLSNMEDQENLNAINGLINSDLLNDRERAMLAMNMQGMSHEAIANHYGLSRSRITKIVGNSLKKIKKELADYYEFKSRA